MSRLISLLDVLNKVDFNIPHTQTSTTKDELRVLFMATGGWPIIGSECTFNEKIRTMLALKILKKIKQGKNIYLIDWDMIDRLLVELAEVN